MTAQASSISGSVSQWTGYYTDYIRKRDGIHKIGELGVQVLDWMPYFSFSDKTLSMAKGARYDIKNLTWSLSIPEFIEGLFSFKNSFAKLQTAAPGEAHKQALKDATTDGIGALCSFCDSLSFADSRKLLSLGTFGPHVEALFWATLCWLGWTGANDQNADSKEIEKLRNATTNKEHVAHYNRLTNISNMKFVSNVCLVAMSVLGLVSLLFASGVMVLPTVFLGCTTTYILACIAIYFSTRVMQDNTPKDLKKLV